VQIGVIVLLVAAWILILAVGVIIAMPLTLVVATLAVLGDYYLQACRVLIPGRASGPSVVEPPETAYRHYLLGQVWRDWRVIAQTVAPRAKNVVAAARQQTTAAATGGARGFFALPLWLGVCAGLALAVVPVAALTLVLTLMYAVVVVIGLAGWLGCVLVLGAIERVFMAYGRVLQTCPHPSCYEKIALPVYSCPSCDRRHRRLTPGPAGAFRHVCRCGTRLPTTIPLGRFRLTAYCPHCERRLPERIGRVRVEPLPFIGGPAAGKTTFMFLAIQALHTHSRGMGGRVAFVEQRHQQAYAGAVEEFRRGGQLAKTGPELPLATMVDVELPGVGHRILYLFDPAGEHFAGASQVESLHYLDHGEALLFVVDPFALPEVRRTLTEAEIGHFAHSSDEDPSDTLQRVLNELRSRPDRGRQKRVAVVVTKADLLARTVIGHGLTAQALPAAPGRPPTHPDHAVRAWLERLGLGNTTRTLDQLAAQVRYFSSGLDTPPAEVFDLLGWVTGLSQGGRAEEPGVTPPSWDHQGRHEAEVPGTAPLRDPWHPTGRDASLVPRSYQSGRWAILTGLSLLNLAALAWAMAYLAA
jgi:Double-GTPase 2